MKELNRKPEILHALRIQVIGSRSKRRDEDEESGSEEEMNLDNADEDEGGIFCIPMYTVVFYLFVAMTYTILLQTYRRRARISLKPTHFQIGLSLIR